MAQAPTQPATCWWYTLAHEDTPVARLGASSGALGEFAEALAARGHAVPATLVTRITREAQRTDLMGVQSTGERYVWAFRRLDDALAAFRANRRSDYHPYPQPQTLREASLDRLYRRFPLWDYPRTTALLFRGARVCDDPRLWADPRPETLASALPFAIAQEDWDQYTLCGFRRGVTLVRVASTTRWLRVGFRTLEDTWADLVQQMRAGDLQPLDESRLQMVEALARESLLHGGAQEAFAHSTDTAASPAAVTRALSRVAPRPQRAAHSARRHAV